MTTPQNTGGYLVRRKLKFEKQFTQIPNAYLRDKRISRKARGLLAELMTHSDGQEVSLKSLADGEIDGVASIRSAVVELEKHGYLVRDNETKGHGNRYATRWELTEPTVPLFENTDLTAFENRTREPVDNSVDESAAAFENRTRSAFENRTHKRTPLRTPIKSYPSSSSTGVGESVDLRSRPSGDGFALAASVELMNAPDAAVCQMSYKRRGPHTPDPANSRYCLHCGERVEALNLATGEIA